MGHRVTVFEAREPAGRHAALRHSGSYRLPRERLDEDLRGILWGRAPSPRAAATRVGAARAGARSPSTYHAVYVAVGAQAGKTARDMPRAWTLRA